MADPVPTIGRIVLYTLTEQDADAIKDRRVSSTETGNTVAAGDVFPMLIVRVWGDDPGPDAVVNGRVFLDGTDTLWVTSVQVGAGPRHFTWPVKS